MRKFFYRKQIVAGRVTVILCSAAVLCIVFSRHHPECARVREEARGSAAVPVEGADSGTGVSGSEVKKRLLSLRAEDGYAVILATQELLSGERTADAGYLVYPLDEHKRPRTVTASDGRDCMLFGVNYGCVLESPVLMNTGLGEDSYYTMTGFLEEDECALRNNYAIRKSMTVITRRKFYPYDADDPGAFPVSDSDLYWQGVIYDRNEREIGCIYYRRGE